MITTEDDLARLAADAAALLGLPPAELPRPAEPAPAGPHALDTESDVERLLRETLWGVIGMGVPLP